MRLTLAEFKTKYNWAQVLNLSVTDARWLQYLNEASERLLNMGMWVGTTARYAVCTKSACLTWPRQFQSIIAMDVCDRPITIRSQWHEFLENGPGLARIKCCTAFNSYDRGSGFAMFDDITVNSKIRLYTQFSTDAGKTVTIRGLDENRQPVLTSSGNIEGEVMTLTGTYVDSVTTWSRQAIREVIKQKTKGFVRAYAYDASLPVPPASPGPDDTPLTPLAVWEPTETLPDYRRSFIPALSSRRGGCCNDGLVPHTDCDKTKVTVIAKIKFITIENDLDFLPIGNAPALKMAMLAVMKEERGDYDGARIAMHGSLDPVRRRYFGGAIPTLEEELDSYQGAGMVNTLRLESGNIAGAQILNLI